MAASRSIRLGPYELVEQIAQGAYGEIYRAKHVGPAGFQRILAIKRLKRHVMADPAAVRAFENEARIGGLLLHHNIAQTLEFNQHEGHYYLAMEFVDGVSFQDIIAVHSARGTRVPEPIALELAAQACDGLHYAHEARTPEGVPLNLVHRDIKPSNLMLTRSGVVKVMDFGIARVDNQTLTDAGFIKGTPRYLSPEVIAGGDGIDRRSDLFSLGTVLYELLALEYLFDAPNLLTLMSKVRTAEVKKQLKALSKRNPGTAKLLSRVLTSEPDKRFSSAREMARELRQLKRRLSRDDVDLEAFAAEVLRARSQDQGRGGGAPAETRPSGSKPPAEPVRADGPTPGGGTAGLEKPPSDRGRVGTTESTPPAQQAPRASGLPVPRFGSRSLADRPPVLPDVKLKTTSITVDQLMDGWGKPARKPARVDLRRTDPGPISASRPTGSSPQGQPDPKTSEEPTDGGESGATGADAGKMTIAAASLLPDGLPDAPQSTPSPIPADRVTSLMGTPHHVVAHPPSAPESVPGHQKTPEPPPAPPRVPPEENPWDPDEIPTHMIDLKAMRPGEASSGTPAQASGARPAHTGDQATVGAARESVTAKAARSPGTPQQTPNLAHQAPAGDSDRLEDDGELPVRDRPDLLKTRVSTSLGNWDPDLEDLGDTHYTGEEVSDTAAVSRRQSPQPNGLGFGMAATILGGDEEDDTAAGGSPQEATGAEDGAEQTSPASSPAASPAAGADVSAAQTASEVETEVLDLRNASKKPIVELQQPDRPAKQPAPAPPPPGQGTTARVPGRGDARAPVQSHAPREVPGKAARPAKPAPAESLPTVPPPPPQIDREPTTAPILRRTDSSPRQGEPDAGPAVASRTAIEHTQPIPEDVPADEPTEPKGAPSLPGNDGVETSPSRGESRSDALGEPTGPWGASEDAGIPERRQPAPSPSSTGTGSIQGAKTGGSGSHDLPVFEPTAAVPPAPGARQENGFDFEPTAARPIVPPDAPGDQEVLEPTSFRPAEPIFTGTEERLEPTSFRPAPGAGTRLPAADENQFEPTAAKPVAGRGSPSGKPDTGPSGTHAESRPGTLMGDGPPDAPEKGTGEPPGTPSRDLPPTDPLAEMPTRSAELPTRVLDVSGPGAPSAPAPRPIASLESTAPSAQAPGAEIGLKFDPEDDVEIWHRRIVWGGGVLAILLVLGILFALTRC